MREARYWTKLGKKVQCNLCPHRCVISEGSKGRCRARESINGKLMVNNYGKCVGIISDPIEKKPLRTFHPGTTVLSVGTVGCNFKCNFCQNWKIAQKDHSTVKVTPEQIVNLAIKNGDIGIAYTYTEPSIWFEFVLDTARLARAKGLKNILITNGYVEKDPLEELLEYIDAANIDLKGFTDDFYKRICGGKLDPVKRTIELAGKKCHVELTTVLVPGENDSPQEIKEMIDWIVSVGGFPLNLSKLYPSYRANLPTTPDETMEIAYTLAKEKLANVFVG